jgi:hypothetical protein
MAEMIWEPTRNEALTVTNTSQSIMSPRTEGNERQSFVIRNISDDDTKIVTLHLGRGSAVANTGIVLKRNEIYAENTDNGFTCWQGEITAICAVASATDTLAIFER